MCTEKMRALSYIGAEKITFLSKLDIRTDRSNYRVASLLKRESNRLSGNVYRGIKLSKLFLAVLGVTVPSLKSIGQF